MVNYAALMLRRFAERNPPSREAAAPAISSAESGPFSGPTRYVPDAHAHFAALRKAAEDYPDAVASDIGLDWMRRKPFDPGVGHPVFFNCMYAVMNAIQAMRLPPKALVVEIGSGPGWFTSILIGLGYRVLAVEPSASMNDLATQRVAGFSTMTGVPSQAVFLTATLEEASLEPYYGQADGVIFHEALHHVIDEHEAIRRVFALLQPGGCLAICGEGRWHPGDRTAEMALDHEMDRYGTLESPFTQGYLRHLLEEAGFVEITFHHSVNGLFPVSQEGKAIRDVARPSGQAANTVLASKPQPDARKGFGLTQFPERTAAEIRLTRAAWEADYLAVEVTLRNTGETYWPAHAPPASGVTLALVQDGPDAPAPEAGNRYPLPAALYPGEEAAVSWIFNARGLDKTACRLRLVAEDAFWFTGGEPVAGPR